ncbi:hypothetical protein F5883DRAFT_619663 [Diaporthe sp. PMI_573]|nr:hypothetical protein F5883DRAFT_619663 [Diaporthaceae sp. PMI_573]
MLLLLLLLLLLALPSPGPAHQVENRTLKPWAAQEAAYKAGSGELNLDLGTGPLLPGGSGGVRYGRVILAAGWARLRAECTAQSETLQPAIQLFLDDHEAATSAVTLLWCAIAQDNPQGPVQTQSGIVGHSPPCETAAFISKAIAIGPLHPMYDVL